MAKSKIVEEVAAGTTMLYCPYYRGQLALMSKEAKTIMKAENPKMYKSHFGEDAVIQVEEVITIAAEPII